MSKRKTLTVLVIAVAILLSSVSIVFGASGTKKMTVYDGLIKKGNVAYCATGNGIYSVNIKSGKVKKLAKSRWPGHWPPMFMKLHKGYIYYTCGGGTVSLFYRVKTNGKSHKSLPSIEDYAISGNRIYYRVYDQFAGKFKYRQMNLNGSDVKKSNYKIKMRKKHSNAKGYKIKYVELSNGKYSEYLVKPNKKKIKICTYTVD